MNLLDINDLDSSLDSPGFWTQEHLLILSSILSCCPNKVIRKNDLIKIGVHIEDSFNTMFETYDGNGEIVKYRFSNRHKRQCNDVIEILQNHNWICSFFQLKRKVYRPSVTPLFEEELSSLDILKKLRNDFWSGSLPIVENIPLMLVVEILTGTGIHYSRLEPLLKQNTLLSNLNAYISIPIIENSDVSIRLPLSARARLLLSWIKRYIQLNASGHSSMMSWLKPYLEGNQNLLSVAHYQLCFEGVESVIFAQLQRDQLPVPLPHNKENSQIVFRYRSDDLLTDNTSFDIPKIIPRLKKETLNYCHEYKTLANLDDSAEEIESVIPWGHESSITLSQIRYQLKKLLTDDQGTYHNNAIPAQKVERILFKAKQRTLDRAKQRALMLATYLEENLIEQVIDHLEFAFTGLDLALHRIRLHLIERGNTLDTCFNEISSLFEYGLLRYPACNNLQNWDNDDLETLTSDYLFDRMKERQISDETQLDTLRSLFSLIRYGQEEFDIFRAVELPKIVRKSTVLTTRNHIFGPTEFDRIKIPNNPVCILAFYGGMRSGEIANLTLNDIVSGKDELIIYIKKGKTPSARRSIPLHLLAPPKIVQKVRDYYEYRLIHYRVYKNKSGIKKVSYLNKSKVPLLSANGECSTNTAASVVRHALVILQSQADEGADLHLLRHSFASMMFLRWYCCKYPDLVKHLVDKKHWCFTQKGLAELKVFFGEKPDAPLPHSNITAIVHLIKLMGHKNTDTFFKVYVHSYDVVLEHALRRTHEKYDQMSLLGNLITELVPGMRSRGNQVNLKSRKVKDLVKLI